MTTKKRKTKQLSPEAERINLLKKELRELRYKSSLRKKIERAREAIKACTRQYPLWIGGFGDDLNLEADLAEKVLSLLEKEKGVKRELCV